MSAIMISCASEKASLLPITEPRLEVEGDSATRNTRLYEALEYLLLLFSLFLTSCQFLILYNFDGTAHAPFPSHCVALLNQLARGLRISIPASLLSSVFLFIIAPYIARPEKIVLTRYTILVCYLVGSFLGGLLI